METLRQWLPGRNKTWRGETAALFVARLAGPADHHQQGLLALRVRRAPAGLLGFLNVESASAGMFLGFFESRKL